MKRCVYTALTGGYEPLNEQRVARESGLPFICFTDDPGIACEGWEIRPLTPFFSADDIRNQRTCKMQPHLVLPEFDQSLYIDNSVQLSVPPEHIFEAADLATGMCLLRHSFRTSLREEFAIVAGEGLDDPRRLAEQLDHYTNAFPQILAGPVFWGGMLLRDHHAPRVRAAMAVWFAHVCRYSRRDQLSSAVAFHLAGLKPGILALDNHVSEFHTWPHLSGRKAERRLWQDGTAEAVVSRTEHLEVQQALGKVSRERDSLLNETERRRRESTALQLERDLLRQEFNVLYQQHRRSLQECETLRCERDALRDEREMLLQSLSWRLTAPMRGLKLTAMAFKNRAAAKGGKRRA
jgi:hypothetical protein